jgi:hypothetical protein
MVTEKVYLDKEFDRIWSKIENNDNFAFVRYGDGERKILTGSFVKAQEGWIAPNHKTELSKALQDCLEMNEKNFFHGISCPCCDRSSYYWYNSNLVCNKNITFANLFVNKNFSTFITKFEKLRRNTIVIANYRGINKTIGSLNILKYYPVSDDCIKFWDENGFKFIQDIKDDTKNLKDTLFLLAAGPLSGPIIAELYKENPNNCYIDVGSAIDFYVHNKNTRSYQKNNSKLSRRNCWMFDPSEVRFDVSVILNLYKRPECLEKQIEAIEAQSLKAREIIIFHDKVSTGEDVQFPTNLKKRFNLIEVAKKNKGVWGRFKFAQNAQSYYCCVFDDDTIPGTRWLESCHYHMQRKEGLFGANGVIMIEPKTYPDNFISLGWKNPNTSLCEVDFVGHSWFFKKNWLDILFKSPQSIKKLKICGEDMSFSYQLKKNKNIPTFVPPHPFYDYDFFGSLPKYARKYGGSKVALSASKENKILYNKAINILLNEDYYWENVLVKEKAKLRNIKYYNSLIQKLSGLVPIPRVRRSFRGYLLTKLLYKKS